MPGIRLGLHFYLLGPAPLSAVVRRSAPCEIPLPMKVIEDKVTVYPPHAICKADVPVIFSALPSAWTAGIQTVRLCSAQKENPTVIAFFHPPAIAPISPAPTSPVASPTNLLKASSGS